MRSNIIRFGLTFLRGFLTAIAIHCLAVLGVKSTETAWHLIGHIAGIVAIQIVSSHN